MTYWDIVGCCTSVCENPSAPCGKFWAQNLSKMIGISLTFPNRAATALLSSYADHI